MEGSAGARGLGFGEARRSLQKELLPAPGQAAETLQGCLEIAEICKERPGSSMGTVGCLPGSPFGYFCPLGRCPDFWGGAFGIQPVIISPVNAAHGWIRRVEAPLPGSGNRGSTKYVLSLGLQASGLCSYFYTSCTDRISSYWASCRCNQDRSIFQVLAVLYIHSYLILRVHSTIIYQAPAMQQPHLRESPVMKRRYSR